MSVIGIDFGNETCKLCVLKKGAIETVLNEASKRKNPTLVSFQGKRRLISEQASSVALNNYKNTIVNVKRIIGKEWNDVEAQVEIKSMPNKEAYQPLGTSGDPNGIGCKVQFNDSELVLSSVEAAAMVFGKLKDVCEEWLEGSREVRDCVISVPGYYTDAQRTAIVNAAKIAGWNPLSLLNEHMASALDFGIWKSARNMFDTAKYQHHMFVEIGHASSSVCVAGFIQGQLKILSFVYDRNLGGRAMDDALVNHFATEFANKYRGMDPRKNPKSAMKLAIACEKAKCTLTPEGVTAAPLNVECLVEEQDFHTKLTLEEFDKIIDPLLPRLDAMIEQAKKESGISEFASVEIVGGAARVRAFKRRVAQACGLFDQSKSNYGLSTTLDMDESIARGCALRCAMLSPSVRVKEFVIADMFPYAIRVSWDPLPVDALVQHASEDSTTASAGADTANHISVDAANKNSVVLFERNCEMPRTRRLTLRRAHDFDIHVEYDVSCEQHLAPGSSRLIGKFTIGNVTKLVSATGKKAGNIRVDFRLDSSGLVRIESACLLEDTEVENTIVKKMKKSEAELLVKEGKAVMLSQPPAASSGTPIPHADANAAAADNNKMEIDESDKKGDAHPSRSVTAPPSTAAGDVEVSVQMKETKKKTTKTDLPINEELFKVLSKEDLAKSTAKQVEFVNMDRIIKETLDTRNKLESLIYSYRDRLDGELREFAVESELTAAKAGVEKCESWLYDEGDDVAKDVYEAKIREFMALFDKMEFRFNESQTRTTAASELTARINEYMAVANSNEEKHAHISQPERDTVRKACDAALKWVNEKLQAQGALKQSADPVLTTAMINDKIEDIRKVCKPIADKKAPTPSTTPTPAAANGGTKGAGKSAKNGDKKGADANGAESAKQNGEAEKDKDSMDLD